MKYLRTYEFNKEPQIGDYVVCKELEIYGFDPDNKLIRKVDKFLSENIGQIVKMIEHPSPYLVQYLSCPYNLADKAFKFGYSFANAMPKCRGMHRDEIIYWSPNKEDCETFITAKKYNL